MANLRANFATYVTWKDLFRVPSTPEELREEIEKLTRLQVIEACALVNVVLKTWQGNVDLDEHERLLNAVFSQEFAARLNRLAREGNPPQLVFHRQQLLFLIKEAAVHCPNSVRDQQSGFNAAFARCCLRANDLLHYGAIFDPHLHRVDRLMPEMVTINDYASRESPLRKIARTRIMLDQILGDPEIRSRPEFVDIPGLFSSILRLSVREYSTFVFGILTRYLKLTVDKYTANRELFVVTKAYFGGTLAESGKVDSFFRDVSTNTAGLEEACRRSTARNDFTVLRDHPLLEVADGRFVALDLGFVVDKLETGVFWRVHSLALDSKQKRDNLHTLWGHLFESYVCRLLANACKGSLNGFIANPEFERTGQASDALIVCGSTAIIMECKGSMLTAEAKYSGSPERLTQEIEAKFVGTEENPKGVRQLARTVKKLGNKRGAEGIRGVIRVSRVFPVLVARDSALTSPFVNRYLNEKFKSLYDRKQIRPTVTPLFVLGIDELEEISPYLRDNALDQILESKYRADASGYFPFSAVHNEILDSMPARVNNTLEEQYEAVIDEACRDLFGRPLREVEVPGFPAGDPSAPSSISEG